MFWNRNGPEVTAIPATGLHSAGASSRPSCHQVICQHRWNLACSDLPKADLTSCPEHPQSPVKKLSQILTSGKCSNIANDEHTQTDLVDCMRKLSDS